MKKILLLTVSLSLLVCVSFAQKPKPVSPKPKNSPVEDTIQYSLGVYMMQQLFAKTGFVITNPTLFKKAIDDVANNKPLMVNPASTEARLLAYQRNFQLENGKKMEKLLFDKVKTTPGFSALPSGVYYSIITAGKGIVPTEKDTIILNVTTTLPDGTVIEDANKSKNSYLALLADMNPGLRDLILRMPEGTICRAIVPAALAYGEQGTSTIPPNSALIYDLGLVSVRKAR
ncbi:MAG: FKBP-type peptidyl-prolyl cis-trans isomerase [Chitinophagaceae bacterium]|nr:FKBP-type peptidyl-prolyl cis-trans isomerase [Chitinophagaceae bacterium]MDP1762251.1 FKBP-type peptidyl-prolyl cis-trans isomerase [Sediminibacterium sp.]MDP1809870.1 FKBP-type peptidyl-prolyl cis-trans isomerase [Sediminibacterium sp.]MDP3129518.1 FKBP-type peptidyl-prolyl cis-trans isomerase [Sediminibacterium sp.]